ncbi:GyrI-like domain-containing protein [Pedobacter nyackensis]|uniref:GyrI-like domain-containing protein n=1 Tax=Pedobacter nyackensis TaxID=475255 RepID=UPI00292FEB0B|nr:GyrI-like domain-containing protein [Pedobacter nyackensis]
MEKFDLTKHYKSYYTAKAKPEILDIEATGYLSISGSGDPSGPLYAEHLQALYSVAYGLKFQYKAKGKDFTVAKLEGLWDFDEAKYGLIVMEEAPLKIPRSEWHYRLLIRLPDFVTAEAVEQAKLKLKLKKNIPHLQDVVTFDLPARKVVQMLHVGPFDREPETLAVMKTFINEHKFGKAGLHHEIYLSDYRKTAPEKLKTILREPVR